MTKLAVPITFRGQRRQTRMVNNLKALVESGQPAIGSWIGFTDPYSVEAMADMGFDWLLIDTEHFPISRESLRTILVAMKGSQSVPVVRLPSNSPDHFQTALDLGAQGVVVPMVSTREDAAQAVTFCRYPPLGTRGFSPTRASRYFQDAEQYAATANGEISLIVQIETPQAVANIDAILATSGIDGIFIGPSDLASFMNLRTRTNHPEVERVVGQLIDSACAHSMPFGLPTWTPDECLSYVKRGARLLTLGSDLHFLANSGRSGLAGIRQLLAANPAAGLELHSAQRDGRR
ncbi:MAG TPA: aldolase/citrate lyase family protein [Bryobacteraceae bacterium]|nr:aldolase/citrate lyase family protein [Bryobacteraceae bacterium]